VALASAGFAIALYLTLYQSGVLHAVFEPLFGDGSRRVLHSALSRAAPVPDSSLGAVAYALEAIGETVGGPHRYRDTPLLVLAVGVLAAGLAVGSLGLVAYQLLVVRAACTLCLASAAISLTVPWLVLGEARAALVTVRARRRVS
jgi:uncharacterized membrane protein